jgi:hypothetical protein
VSNLGELLLPDAAALADLHTFLGRARRVDPDGATRLAAHGDRLAAYVSPLHLAEGPTVLGLRVAALGAESSADVTVALAAMLDRTARLLEAAEGPVAVPLPPNETAVPWAGISPPRAGWQAAGEVPAARLLELSGRGIDEIAAGTTDVAGAPAVNQLRRAVWGRPLGVDLGPWLGATPVGVAFAFDALGFGAGAGSTIETVSVHRAGPWVRLSTPHGHVLARSTPVLAPVSVNSARKVEPHRHVGGH